MLKDGSNDNTKKKQNNRKTQIQISDHITYRVKILMKQQTQNQKQTKF